MVTASEGRPRNAIRMPVEDPGEHPAQQARSLRRRVKSAAVHAERADDRRRHPDDAGDREVDLAGDDDQRHRQREQQHGAMASSSRYPTVIGGAESSARNTTATTRTDDQDAYRMPSRLSRIREARACAPVPAAAMTDVVSTTWASLTLNLRAVRSFADAVDDDGRENQHADDRLLPELVDAHGSARELVDGREQQRADGGAPDRAASRRRSRRRRPPRRRPTCSSSAGAGRARRPC